ncbi:hypothetical protein [Desulfonatronum parangueonense]
MQKIPLNLAREGMKLAKPVLRDNGLVLVAENTELTGSLLERLERMEIAMVTVQGNPVDLGAGAGANPYSVRAGRLDHLFRKHESDPWMQKNKEHLKNYFQLKAASSVVVGEQGGQDSSGGHA